MVQDTVPPEPMLLTTVKRNLLVGKVCLFCLGLSSLHVALDAFQGLYESVVVDIILMLILAFAWLLNHWKYHLGAKLFVLSFLNLLFAFYTSVLPKEVGTYLYYFPLIVTSSAFFDSREKKFRYTFNAVPLILLGMLLTFDFDIIPSVEFQSPVTATAFFTANVFSSAVITIICVNFMQKLNVSSEHELKQLAEEVNGKNIHLEKTNAELDRFLYSTSHDLRSPLSSIKGLVNIARMETNDEKIQRYFSMMIDRVDKLDSFIKDIIDYSKNARTEVRNEDVDFDCLLREVTENLKYIEGADAIEFKTNVLIGHPVNADKSRLSVVLNNLMANAIKYHDPQKSKQWIDVEVSNSNGTLKLQVSDNGIGIDHEHQDRVFDMFYRGTFQSKGSGLGLYIVKETVAKMNGTVSLNSTPGVGSSFLITVPVV